VPVSELSDDKTTLRMIANVSMVYRCLDGARKSVLSCCGVALGFAQVKPPAWALVVQRRTYSFHPVSLIL
jgi:hypothetical protein